MSNADDVLCPTLIAASIGIQFLLSIWSLKRCQYPLIRGWMLLLSPLLLPGNIWASITFAYLLCLRSLPLYIITTIIYRKCPTYLFLSQGCVTTFRFNPKKIYPPHPFTLDSIPSLKLLELTLKQMTKADSSYISPFNFDPQNF